MTQSENYKWSEDFIVRSYEVHNDGHVNMPAICNYLQEIAGNHAENLGLAIDQMEERNWTWFLSHLKVEMLQYPSWRDRITLTTWPSTHDNIHTERDFQIFKESGELTGRAVSSWVIIDLKTRRPIRIPDEVKSLIRPDCDRSMEAGMRSKIRGPEDVLYQRSFSVRYMDLDVNNHVNNVHYIEWAMEALPEEILTGKKLNSVDIIFRSECRYGETVHSLAGIRDGDSENIYRHRLVRDSDQKEIAVVETNWQ